MEYLDILPYSSMAGALEYQAATRPEKVALLYPDPTANYGEYASLTYYECNNVVNHLAEKLHRYLPSPSSAEPQTCALLLAGGLEYLLSQYAVLKLGNVVMFPISTRNSPAAIEHLLKETKTRLLVTISLFAPMIQTIQEQQKELQPFTVVLLDSEEFRIEDLLRKKDVPCSVTSSTVAAKRNRKQELNRVAVILHSSGSTAHPRPIALTNRCILLGHFTYLSINADFWQESDVILVWGPLFHLMAFSAMVHAVVSGCTYALPLCMTFPPKPSELVHNVQVKNGITILLSASTLLEELIRELLAKESVATALKPLRQMKFVMYSGAGCSDELCRTIVNNGVVLLSTYGSTGTSVDICLEERNGVLVVETGLLLTKNFSPYDKRWKSMQIPLICKPYVRMKTPDNAQGPDEKICVRLAHDPFLAENVANRSDGAYVVGDILREEPAHSGHYHVVGRHDDTLVHITGEKTNPVPMENTIGNSPFVKRVVVVGHNQFCTAALIELNTQKTASCERKEVEDNVWKFVEEANREAPSHSRLIRPLMYFLANDESLSVTHKGNLIRQKINQDFATVISHIYDRFLNEQYRGRQQANENKKPTAWTNESIQKYIRGQLKSMTVKIRDPSKSIFDFGINSLQVVELQNAIREQICPVPKNFIYKYSSLNQMTDKLLHFLAEGSAHSEPDEDPFHYQLTEHILNKYIDLIQSHPNPASNIRAHSTQRRVFLLTGANGSLGCFILQDLLSQPKTKVKRVYCLLRGSHPRERLFKAYAKRQLDTSMLIRAVDKRRLIIVPSSMNLTDECLGLSEKDYADLRERLTDIIHSAWKMNFNQTIADFEQDCILGLYHLLKLAAFKRSHFHFISSISSAASGLASVIHEKPLPRQAQIALPLGYGQSKYVGEHLCWTAEQVWNVPVNIFRVGQISGDTTYGIWNTTELAAMMIYAGAGQLHQMPNVGNELNWIPVDVCSAAVVELALKAASDQHVYHLLNPKVIPYSKYLRSLRRAGLIFETVSQEQFMQSVLTAADQTNPLIKLSAFLEQNLSEVDHSQPIRFETTTTIQHSCVLQTCPRISSKLIRKYLDYWKHCRLLRD